jgi:hypothetical protein
MLTPEASRRLLKILLRIGGVSTGSAFLAVFLPVEWMAAIHQWLGLGEFPQGPVTQYLARSVSAFYGFHGALLLYASRDPAAHSNIIWFVAGMSMLFGVMLFAIQLHAGLPTFWVLGEGPFTTGMGVVLALLNRVSDVRSPD